jgi:cation:H+ antiporter
VAVVVGGLAALWVVVRAAGVAVDRSVAVARRYEVPDVLVAMTVIAVGTSLPELATHLSASLGILGGELDYAVASATVIGGNMGSSTVQQLLLFGALVLAFGRFSISRAFLRGVYVPMVAALSLVLAVSLDGTVSRLDGGILLATYLAYVWYRSRTLQARTSAGTAPWPPVRSWRSSPAPSSSSAPSTSSWDASGSAGRWSASSPSASRPHSRR